VPYLGYNPLNVWRTENTTSFSKVLELQS
jgi:hypothetical protein